MRTKLDKFIPLKKGEIIRYYKNKLNEAFIPEPVYISHRESFDWFITSELAIIVDKIYTERSEMKKAGKGVDIRIKNISLLPVGKPEDCIKLHKTYTADIEVTFEINGSQIKKTITAKDYELPYMTPSCTFIIYGKEKIFINQLRKNMPTSKQPVDEADNLEENYGDRDIAYAGENDEDILENNDSSGILNTSSSENIEKITESDPYEDEHLKNKHVITIGNVLADSFSKALNYFYNIVEKSSHKAVAADTSPDYCKIFIKCLSRHLYYLFHKNDYLQPLDRLNPLSVASQFNMLTNMGKGGLSARAGFEPRDVNNSYYCRLCPIETPEGKNCGLIHHLSSYARIKVRTGVIETPYIRLADNNAYWFGPEDDENINITEARSDINAVEKVLARHGKDIKRYSGPDIRYKEVATDQMLGASASLIPFLEHDDVHRALMAASMQKQAVPLLHPELPIVGTGREYQIAKDISALNLLDPELSIKDGELALGKNLLVAYMPWKGYNYEDAIVISQELVDKDILTSIHKNELTCTLGSTQALIDDKLTDEYFTAGIPNVRTDALDENGIIRLNEKVRPGDILVGRLIPSPFASTPISSSIFGGSQFVDGSLYADDDTYGTVTSIRYLDITNAETKDLNKAKSIIVTIEQERKITLGDKLAGRHGNKGVVSVILPEDEMPYIKRADGTKEHIQVLLNPLGVPSRMNIGQLFEAHLGFIARELGTKIASHKITQQQLKPYFQSKTLPKTVKFGRNGYIAIPFAVPAFNGPTLMDIRKLYKCAGLDDSCKTTVYNPDTDKPYANQIMVGIAYMLKLDHLVDDKIHVRSSGRYTQITEQPLQGRSNDGGQRLGEMEMWALEAHGATNNLLECLTIKSDDIVGRDVAETAIRKGKAVSRHGLPESFRYLVKTIKSLGFDIEIRDKERQLMEIDEISPTIE